VHRSTFTTRTARLAAREFCYYADRWHTHQVCPAMYSVSWDDGILWPHSISHSNGTCFLWRHVWPKNTWLKYELQGNIANKTNLVHNSFFVCLFLFPTCFRQSCAHHQEKTTVSIRHLVFVTLCGWPSGRQGGTKQLPRTCRE
jgi:hypothetical protein